MRSALHGGAASWVGTDDHAYGRFYFGVALCDVDTLISWRLLGIVRRRGYGIGRVALSTALMVVICTQPMHRRSVSNLT